jgi:hypothetical protein
MTPWKKYERSVRDLVKALCQHLPGGTEDNQEKSHLLTAGVPVRVQINHLPYTSQEHRYANLNTNFQVA